MRMKSSICVSAIVAFAAFGCGDSKDDAPPTVPSPDGGAPLGPQTGTAGKPAPTTPSATAGTGPSIGTSPTTPVTPPAGAAGAPGSVPTTPTTPGTDPSTPELGAGGARFPDACSERRGSWGKPCTSNPDPCNLKSGYPGDEYCMLPPPEGKGIQIHFGPKDYKNAADVAKYILKAGEEYNSYGIVNIPTTETKYYQYLKVSMRPGSHHLINNLMQGHPAEGFVAGRAGCDGSMLGSFPGTQNLIKEDPPQGIPAPENEKIGRTLPGNASICQNYHRYNNTDKDALSEIWYNIWFVDEKEITEKTAGVMINAGPWQGIAPGEKRVLTLTATTAGAGRIISLFGHRHAATERFAAWQNDKLIYDSWDWVESRLFNYDSITQNPPVNETGKTDGAVSGVLDFKQGDKIKIECHVNNTTDQTLTFANELYTGEMCILFGATVGTPINSGLGAGGGL